MASDTEDALARLADRQRQTIAELRKVGPQWKRASDGGDIIEIMDKDGAIIGTAVDAETAQRWIASEKVAAVLGRILRAHESGNNGAYRGEAVLCRSFAEDARRVIEESEGKR